MRIGIVFPQTEIGADPIVIRDYAQAAEDLGFAHLLAYDHVLGADPGGHPGWQGAYTSAHMFHEPLVLCGYLAGLTRRIELTTGVIILPQRQTVLVAKQAAEVDVLSSGRLRLGVGVGWNPVEFAGLGESFHNRGRRIAEQVAVLRALWTSPAVTFSGRYHRITAAGINPLPVQRPIPIWMGGHAEPVLRRIGAIGDGWFPLRRPPEGWDAVLERLRGYVREAGRDPSAVGVEGRFSIARRSPEGWARAADEWRRLGATHLHVVTMDAGLQSPAEHIAVLRQIKEALGV
ncbi:MAG: TIGR03619 family F420-dependent LLM class oxidoreductase [Chloroflexi bacterium]|nr:TIGR03619 family F420-dependent LLM class oxidoreductase [Chloroflexota bacterium]